MHRRKLRPIKRGSVPVFTRFSNFPLRAEEQRRADGHCQVCQNRLRHIRQCFSSCSSIYVSARYGIRITDMPAVYRQPPFLQSTFEYSLVSATPICCSHETQVALAEHYRVCTESGSLDSALLYHDRTFYAIF